MRINDKLNTLVTISNYKHMFLWNLCSQRINELTEFFCTRRYLQYSKRTMTSKRTITATNIPTISPISLAADTGTVETLGESVVSMYKSSSLPPELGGVITVVLVVSSISENSASSIWWTKERFVRNVFFIWEYWNKFKFIFCYRSGYWQLRSVQ